MYTDNEHRLDTTLGSDHRWIVVWGCIRRARLDFSKMEDSDSGTSEFIKWMGETWGVGITMAQDGYNLSHEIDIIAEDKYTMFMLKYQ